MPSSELKVASGKICLPKPFQEINIMNENGLTSARLLSKSGTQLVDIPFYLNQDANTIEIIYICSPNHTSRKGYATNALLGLEKLAFDLGVERITHTEPYTNMEMFLTKLGYKIDTTDSLTRLMALDLTQYSSYDILMQKRLENEVSREHMTKYFPDIRSL